MYPQAELVRLAAHKAALQRKITLRRMLCREAAIEAARPLAWLDRMIAFIHQLSPLAKFALVPLGFVVKRAVFPRLKVVGTLVRWGPLILGAFRGIMAMMRARQA